MADHNAINGVAVEYPRPLQLDGQEPDQAKLRPEQTERVIPQRRAAVVLAEARQAFLYPHPVPVIAKRVARPVLPISPRAPRMAVTPGQNVGG